MDLYVSDPNQVTSFSQIVADLGADNRQLMVLSGIARPEWHVNDDGHLAQNEFVVHQGVYAEDLDATNVNVMVGLCSIHNNDSAFVFAVDQAQVTFDATGEMILTVDAALLGNDTNLSRFSYQIVATLTPVHATISGVVSWPAEIWQPPDDSVAKVGAQVSIIANRVVPIEGPGFGGDQLTPVARGVISNVELRHLGRSTRFYAATYTIENAPLGQLLQVSVDLGRAFGRAAAALVEGPRQFELNVAQPSVIDDFVVSVPPSIK
jgi:hypothetical protein